MSIWLDDVVHLPITEDHSLVIGRHGHADLVIGDASVSRKHAVLRIERGVVTITDLGSTNGTWIDEVRLRKRVPQSLYPGVVVWFGGRYGVAVRRAEDEEGVIALHPVSRATGAVRRTGQAHGLHGLLTHEVLTTDGGLESFEGLVSHDESTVSEYVPGIVGAGGDPVEPLLASDSRARAASPDRSFEDVVDADKLLSRPRARSESAARQMRESEQLAATASMIRSSQAIVDRYRGQFVALQADRMFFRPTMKEARSTLEEGRLALVFRVPKQAKATNEERGTASVHERNIRAFIAALPELRREHPGEWVAIYEGRILGTSSDRRALLAEYHRSERLPVFFAEIPRTEGDDEDQR